MSAVKTATLLAAAGLTSLLALAGPAHAEFGFTAATAEIRADANGTPATQAGSHPFDIVTTLGFKTRPWSADPTVPMPDGQMKDVVVDLPPGVIGDPTAAPRCTQAAFEAGLDQGECPADTQVGLAVIERGGVNPAPIYVRLHNLTPEPGEPARFGGRIQGSGIAANLTLRASVRTGGDYGLRMTTENIPSSLPVTGVKVTFWGVPAASDHDAERGECLDGFSGPLGSLCPVRTERRPFLTTPTSCTQEPLTWRIGAAPWEAPGTFTRTAFDHDANGAPMRFTGCENLRFQPSVSVRPDTTAPATPAGFAIDVKVPQTSAPTDLATPHVQRTVVTLPEGVAISPGAADGLQGCTDAQVGVHDDQAPACPDASKIGTVAIDTPVLHEPMEGSVYLGTQESRDPASGRLFRLFLVAEGAGVWVKLPGAIVPDPRTGRLTTSFDALPQLPFSELRLRFKGGARAPLTTPATCGTKTAIARLTAWSGQAVDQESRFGIDCTPNLGGFAPTFAAGTATPVAAAFSPFVLKIGRPDGNSDLTGLRLELPEGLLARLKGNLGQRVGTARVASGAGAAPTWLTGPVTLEGPYGDAPFSLRVAVPVIAGPFDLGTVVVRQRIYVDRHDAHVTIVSDPLPTIVSGVPVQLQRLEVSVDKPGFMVNPTSCAPKTITGTLSSALGQAVAVQDRFQVGECGSLGLEPKLALKLTGRRELRTGGQPGLDALVTMPGGPGSANLEKVAVTLPPSIALEAENAQGLCTPTQAEARACPAASIVGSATASTPILDAPLAGPVYFVEGRRRTATGATRKTLPKLLVLLRGQGVEIDLLADSSVDDEDRLVTTFSSIPDAPITAFRLQIKGGKRGILAATGTAGKICDFEQHADAAFTGQNGAVAERAWQITTQCALRVVSSSVVGSRLRVKVAGLGAGRLSVSGPGVQKTRRTIKAASVATLRAKLSRAGRRAAREHRTVRATVTFDPAGPAKARRLGAAARGR